MPSGGGWNFAGNRSRVEDCRDHPYMRPSPFMHLQGQIPGGVQLLKEGRLAHGMDINGAAADPRLNIHDICNQGQLVTGHCLEKSLRGE